MPEFNVEKYEAPCDPDGHELARCPAGSFDDWMEGNDHQNEDIQVG